MSNRPKKPDIDRLTLAATRARKNAYAPYSGFRVGAAVLTSSGSIVAGCNVENSSYGLTICAERVALFNAVSGGDQAFTAIAVSTGTDFHLPPCGACRQVIHDLAGNIPVYLVNRQGHRRTVKLKNLLPNAFGPKHLKP